MANNGYLVIRLVPASPVDGGTFATYLNNLRIQVFAANPLNGPPLSDFVYSSPLTLFPWPPGSNTYLSIASVPTSAPTVYNGTDYGNTLTFTSTDGIPVGSYVFTTDTTTIPTPIQVIAATATTVTLKSNLPNYVQAGTIVSFLGQSPSVDPLNPVSSILTFAFPTNGPATALNPGPVTPSNPLQVLPFASTSGIAVGMTAMAAGIINTGTTVAEVNSTASNPSITLSNGLAVTVPPAGNFPVTFTLKPPFLSFSLKTTAAANASTAVLTFNPTASAPNGADGVAVGMTISPQIGIIAPGTTVSQVTATTVTLNQNLIGKLPAGRSVTFTFPLSSGIVQHIEETSGIMITGFTVFNSAAVATAIVPLNSKPPEYLNVRVTATRGTEQIPFRVSL
jgi:hypothetical protein